MIKKVCFIFIVITLSAFGWRQVAPPTGAREAELQTRVDSLKKANYWLKRETKARDKAWRVLTSKKYYYLPCVEVMNAQYDALSTFYANYYTDSTLF